MIIVGASQSFEDMKIVAVVMLSSLDKPASLVKCLLFVLFWFVSGQQFCLWLAVLNYSEQ